MYRLPGCLSRWRAALAINPGAEPALYAFIARICETVRAPLPTRIDIDCQNGDRIRHARQANAPGIFACDFPATSLWNNFEIPAQQVTALHYQDDLGLRVHLSAAVGTKG